MTALADSAAGPIAVSWDSERFGDSWNCRIARNQLIISKVEARKLKRTKEPDAAGSAATATMPKGAKTLPTGPNTALMTHQMWPYRSADRKTSIRARYTGRDGETIYLVNEDGEEFEVEWDDQDRGTQSYLNIVQSREEQAVERQ